MAGHLHIIVLNWNGTKDTIECLTSLKGCDFAEYTVVLVDNGSEEEGLHELESWCNNNYQLVVHYNRRDAECGGISIFEDKICESPSNSRLVFVKNNENLGFAAGNNVALRYSLRSNAEYAMLLNNDTVVEKNAIGILMDFMNSNLGYVAVTPQIRLYDRKDRIWNCGGNITWFGNRRYYFPNQSISKVPQIGCRDITFVTGCALLFKPKVTGILTESFFFGQEDLDFSFKQKKRRNKMACCFTSIIYHKVNASINKLDHKNIGSIYLHYLSRLINSRQHISPALYPLALLLHIAYAIPMVKIRYGYSFSTILRMTTHILAELRRLDGIDKDYFFKYLNHDFLKPMK